MVNRNRPNVISNIFVSNPISRDMWNTAIPVVEEKKAETAKVKESTDRIEYVTHTNVSIGTKATGEISRMICDPTGNCQIQSMVNFNLLLGFYSDNNTILSFLAKGWNKSASKTELLLDVEDKYSTRVEGLFKLEDNDILFKAPYKNNTGTKMIMYLVQIKNKLEREKLI